MIQNNSEFYVLFNAEVNQEVDRKPLRETLV